MKPSRRYLRLLLLALALLVSVAASAQEAFDRGMKTPSVFIEKGQWITGISVNYSAAGMDNYKFFVVEGIHGNNYSFKLSPMALYTFKNDLAAGARFIYDRSMVDINQANLVLSPGMDFGVDHLYTVSHNYGFTGLFRNYISLGASKRFGIFNEVQLGLGGGQSKITNGVGQSLTGTWQKSFNFELGITPGLIMFLNDYSALEVNIGVLGLKYKHTTAITDQVYDATLRTNAANFKINLFSVTFGVAFYL